MLRQVLNQSLKFIRPYTSSTIFALSSGHGKCGVAVIRVSGPNAKLALREVTRQDPPGARKAVLRCIMDPQNGDIIDKGLVLWFPGPRSFTGEDTVEFQVHGSLAVVNALLRTLGTTSNLRLAKPGEFTKKAFFNNKLDLTEVEGLADLIESETEAQLKQAYYQSQGSLSKLYSRWRDTLVKSVAHIEAQIEFGETEEVDSDLEIVSEDVKNLNQEIKQHLSDGRKGEILRDGVKTVILGEPNVGKSSLLNLLCKRPAAIVTPIEGTTRDILKINLNISGYPLVLTDTAGLRNASKDEIEMEGIKRALGEYEMANLVILMLDSSKYVVWKRGNANKTLDNYIEQFIKDWKLSKLLSKDYDTKSCDKIVFGKSCIVVMNKIDILLNYHEIDSDLSKVNTKWESIVKISCESGDGINNLVDSLSKILKKLCGEPSEEHPCMSQSRYRQHLTDCSQSLESFLHSYENQKQVDVVLLVEDLRKALKCLGYLFGAVTTEELLDVIFKDFCIGK